MFSSSEYGISFGCGMIRILLNFRNVWVREEVDKSAFPGEKYEAGICPTYAFLLIRALWISIIFFSDKLFTYIQNS